MEAQTMATKKEPANKKAPAAPAAPQAAATRPPAQRELQQPVTQPRRTAQAGPALESQGSSRGTTSHRSADEIARRAYELWQQRGAPHGSDQEDWHAAERELDKQ
jgi:BRCT domain type II-containing protein